MRWFLLSVLGAAAPVAGCGSDDDSTQPATRTVLTAPPESASTTETADESTGPVPPDDSAGSPEEADDPGADRPRAVEDVVAAVLTGSETPETICDELLTPEYVKTAFGDREGCLAAEKPQALAESVQISDVQESGDTATAVATPVGGPYDEIDVHAKLVAATDLEDAWVVDSLEADVPAGP
jgi:hypothetical protein